MLQETEELLKIQAREWDPILEWFNQKFGVDIRPCPGLLGADIPSPARDTIRRYLLSYDVWAANGECAKTALGRLSSLSQNKTEPKNQCTVLHVVGCTHILKQYQFTHIDNLNE